MKRLLSLTPLLLSTAALALPISYEPFNYGLTNAGTGTNLIGLTSPDGLTWSLAGGGTVNPVTNQPSIAPGSLSISGLAPSQGNSVKFGGDNQLAARYSLNNVVTSGTLYYSFIFRLTDITGLTTSGVFWAGFNNSQGSQSGLPGVVVTRLHTKAYGGGFIVGMDKSSGMAANFKFDSNQVFSVNQDIFVVGSYTFNPGTGDDESRLWINPDSSTFGAAAPPSGGLTNTAGNDISSGQVGSFCLFNRSAAEPKAGIIDELTIGTSWADVTPSSSTFSITAQPRSQNVLAGNPFTLSVSTYRASTFQWRFNGVNIAGANDSSYSLSSAQLENGGNYDVVVGNGTANFQTSSVAVVTVVADIYPRLYPLWSLAPLSRPYLSIDGSSTPNERSIAYNAGSNTVLLVSRTNINFNGLTNANIYVLDANSGADLYQMNTDPAIIQGGQDPSGGTTNRITLSSIEVAADGALYGANIATDNTGDNSFRLYRWDDCGSSTLPVKIWDGDPAGQSTTPRWGDSLTVRGSGGSTEILVDSADGGWGSLILPGDPNNLDQLNWFPQAFTNSAVGGLTSGGRTLVFGQDNTFWEKHKGSGLKLASYDTVNFVSTLITNYNAFPNTLGVVAFDFSRALLVGIDFASAASDYDKLALYDISNPANPLFLASYNFPITHQANGNSNGKVIFAGDRIFALDSNNGLMALGLTAQLSIANTGNSVTLSWSTNTPAMTLQSTTSLTPPVTWTDVGAGSVVGSKYSITETTGSSGKFYRLRR